MSRFEKRAQPIRELANHPDPTQMANALTKNTEGLHTVAPNITQSLQTTGSKAVQFLNEKLPKPKTELLGDRDYEPSKLDQDKWLKHYEIVNDPISVLDHVRHGTLTQNHMEALTSVHPELLDEMRQKVMEHMDSSRVKSLPSSTKIALSTFLGSPISASVLPQAILGNQVALGSAPEAPQMGGPSGVKSTVGGLKELNVAERSATETSHLESEK